VAKPVWASFFIRHDHPVLERIWETLSHNGFGDPFAGWRLFHRLATLFPGTDDSALLPAAAQTFAAANERPLALAPNHSDGHVAIDPSAFVHVPADNRLGGDVEHLAQALLGGGALPSGAGHHPGEDCVFAVTGAPLVDLTGHTDLFI